MFRAMTRMTTQAGVWWSFVLLLHPKIHNNTQHYYNNKLFLYWYYTTSTTRRDHKYFLIYKSYILFGILFILLQREYTSTRISYTRVYYTRTRVVNILLYSLYYTRVIVLLLPHLKWYTRSRKPIHFNHTDPTIPTPTTHHPPPPQHILYTSNIYIYLYNNRGGARPETGHAPA